MQAILTEFIPATNTKPTRVKASCARGSHTISSKSLSGEKFHRAAAWVLMQKFIREDKGWIKADKNPWNRQFVTGCLPNGDYCHVFLPQD